MEELIAIFQSGLPLMVPRGYLLHTVPICMRNFQPGSIPNG